MVSTISNIFSLLYQYVQQKFRLFRMLLINILNFFHRLTLNSMLFRVSSTHTQFQVMSLHAHTPFIFR